MLDIIKRIRRDISLFLIIVICFSSCNKQEEVKAIIYKKGVIEKEVVGCFYSTKYGGLNYYISERKNRDELLNLQDIDSIILNINNKKYKCESIVDKPFSREINYSDFSFFIKEKDHTIKVDTINNLSTIMFFSAKTNMEELKDKKVIKFTMVDK